MRRDLQRIEHGRVGRQLEIAHVGVPDGFASAERADRLAFLVEHVGDHIDVGIADRGLAPALLVGRRIELAEPAAEGQQIVVVDLLAAEQQRGMAVPGPLDLGELGIRDGGEIDARDFGADGRRQRRYGHGHGAASGVQGSGRTLTSTHGDDRATLAACQRGWS